MGSSTPSFVLPFDMRASVVAQCSELTIRRLGDKLMISTMGISNFYSPIAQ